MERCNASSITGGDEDLGRCALPLGHAGMHTPLPVLWQMAGFAEGPWDPERTRQLGDLIRSGFTVEPTGSPICTGAEPTEILTQPVRVTFPDESSVLLNVRAPYSDSMAPELIRRAVDDRLQSTSSSS